MVGRTGFAAMVKILVLSLDQGSNGRVGRQPSELVLWYRFGHCRRSAAVLNLAREGNSHPSAAPALSQVGNSIGLPEQSCPRQAALLLGRVHRAHIYLAGGEPRKDGSRRNVLRDDGAGANDGAVSDRDTLQNDDRGADPDIVADSYSPTHKRLRVDQRARCVPVIMVRDVAHRADHTVAPDLDPLAGVYHCVPVAVDPRREIDARKGSPFAGGQQDDSVVEGDAVTDLDVPRVPRDADAANETMLSDVCAQEAQTSNANPHSHRSGIADQAVDGFVQAAHDKV